MSAPVLLDRVRARLALVPGPPSRAGVAALVREEAGGLLGDDDVLHAVREAVDELAGAGPLEGLLRTPGVTDVLVNGPDQVWLDRGDGLELTPVRFADDDAVRRLAVRLAATVGRRLDDASPWVDVGLGDGTRLHAVLPPVSGSGTCLSLRVLRRTTHSLAELAALGTLPGNSLELLRAVVAQRLAFLVTGGRGRGRRRCCRRCSGPPSRPTGSWCARTQPSSPRASPRHPPGHPPAQRRGVGSVTLRDLVRQALRMRPDRLVVGEVRGAEVTDLLAALNTGHDGGCGTLHANRPREVPARLEALGVAAGLDRAAVHSQAAAALAVVVHLRRTPAGRRVTEVGVVRRSGAPSWSSRGGGTTGATSPRPGSCGPS
ncbi:ATPase, T2SS/T4P/T4SS family [Blastococcus brunescens]|uniref:ATPase, T2SS/T4P/T4SS family n=1 Tax=Blastococcus brunescens TaxID=1564165 RepID=A0ABZ1B2C7_9ACTN|nr:ATPase, T2SS/T4P/T4SS family [Blastococcus sp. BMG 8361]WRL64517.1 ATPase, T2SS/T4P/T4SS family [Blastococcus sp. BMG 8361]